VPAIGSLLLAIAFVAVLLVRAQGDASLLVHAAPPDTDPARARPTLTVQAQDKGFDGQFFYRLGVSPWNGDRWVAGVKDDLPALRNARWGYGALAWLGSAGDPDLVPWSLIAVNLAAALALGAAGGALAHASGRHRAWGLAFVVWPGFAYSLSLDTSELVASAFVLGGLVAARHRRWGLAALALTAAVLTRDTTAVVPFGFALAGLVGWRRGERPTRTDPGPLLTGIVPLAAFGVWQLVQRARFGALPLTSSGDNNLSGPLVGFVDLFRDAARDPGGETAFRVLFALGIVALVGLAAYAWRSSTAPLTERLAWMPAVAVVVLLNGYLWSGATAFMRAATEAGLLSTVVLLGVPAERWRRGAAALVAGGLATGWALTAAVQVAKLG
jgi:hypothetical protein